MEVPGHLLEEADCRIDERICSILGKEDIEGEAVEVFLGQIVNIVEEKRINFDAPHAVVFGAMPTEYRFDRGICFEAHSKALAYFRGPSVQSANDTISFHNTTRKVSTEGKTPTYQRKDKRVLYYVHLPNCNYDAQVAACTTRAIENPDRMPQKYIFPRQRETHNLPFNGCFFHLMRVTDLGKTIDKDNLFSAQNHKLLTYHAGITLPNRKDTVDCFLQALCTFMSSGFVREKNSHSIR